MENQDNKVYQIKIKAQASCSSCHTLFITNKSKPNVHVLLVSSIPPYCNQHTLHRLFGKCGKILEVRLQKHANKPINDDQTTDNFPPPPILGFKVAFITFQSNKGINEFIKKTKSTEPWLISNESTKLITGLKKWCLDYIYEQPDPKKLKLEVDEYMTKYDAKVKQEQEEEIENDGIPDDEGWVKVSSRGRNAGVSRTETNQKKSKRKEKKKRKQNEMFSIYKYQVRESKRQKIAELREKFEEDKLRIQAMKEARKFRPF
nr:ribosomal RNA-processing protein 7 homolog A-like [Ciona intestinalis]|eukprot:XP_002121115.1 ribosomal RNA-processing protein 7 homolog A-like [Ciona intestinalis]